MAMATTTTTTTTTATAATAAMAMASEKLSFRLCSVCRLNHSHGRGHRFTARHRRNLSRLLSKSLRRIGDISYFLRNPARLRDSDRPRNAFWCAFCDANISELDSVFVCSNTIRHLASASHHEALKKFWYENGADIKQRHLYAFQSEELAKWEEACKKVLDVNVLIEASSGAPNNIHPECTSNSIASFEAFSLGSVANSLATTSSPLPPFCKDGSYIRQENGSSDNIELGNEYSSKLCQPEPTLPNVARPTESSNYYRTDKDVGLVGVLTCIRQPSLQPMVGGNVHTGAAPPWLQAMNKSNSGETNKDTNSDPGVSLSRTQKRKLNRLRNPKRVGAEWAERRRAEMAREAMGHQPSSGSLGLRIGSAWMPNFGRVWQTGSRKETRKEFEAETQLQRLKAYPPKQPKAVLPYVSKRQKLEATQQVEE